MGAPIPRTGEEDEEVESSAAAGTAESELLEASADLASDPAEGDRGPADDADPVQPADPGVAAAEDHDADPGTGRAGP